MSGKAANWFNIHKTMYHLIESGMVFVSMLANRNQMGLVTPDS